MNMKKLPVLVLSIIIAVSTSACGFTFDGRILKNIAGTTISEQEELTLNAVGAESFEVFNGAGDIKVRTVKADELSVRAIKKVRAESGENKRIMDNFKIKLTLDGTRLKVQAVTAEDESQDFWKWQQKEHPGTNVSIQYTIDVPVAIKEYKLFTGAGDVNLKNTEGALNISTGAGDVRVDNGSLTGKSVISTGAGKIGMDVNIKNADEVRASTGAGGISLTVPADSGCNLQVSTGVGKLSGSMLGSVKGNSVKRALNGGGIPVTMSTGVGDIRVDKR